jgi:hypothetical protein
MLLIALNANLKNFIIVFRKTNSTFTHTKSENYDQIIPEIHLSLGAKEGFDKENIFCYILD